MNNKKIALYTVIIIVAVALIVVVGKNYKQDGDTAMNYWGNTSNSDTSGDASGVNTNGGTNIGGSVSTTGTSKNSGTTVLSDSEIAKVVANAKITVPTTGVERVLSNGSAKFVNGSVSGTVYSGPIIGKVQTENGYDVFTDMTVIIDKSLGVTHYLALFHVLPNSVTYKSAVVVGDRLTLTSVVASPDLAKKYDKTKPYDSTVGYIVTLNYLDRKNGQPVETTPSLPKTIVYHVTNHFIGR